MHVVPFDVLNSNCENFQSPNLNQGELCFDEPLPIMEQPSTSENNQISHDSPATLEENGSWSIVPLPTKYHIVGCKWVYKTKLNAKGEVERYNYKGILLFFFGN
ncbi:Uncharacterized protein TCM_033461 [Theobroma cacao]|uniref:Reverse transcriptase Ty1/copia-type domain-containing protein n=1 Tax=Theobroma cacao TaxID=3641 RepID=A0A061FBD7_THECC|nr:Uncharacterized protein TCM_033461 [Theobroma cacao]